MQITLLPRNGYFTGARQFLADSVFPEGKNQRNELERAANTHPVIGLPNRRAFELAQATAEADQNTAIVFFDANNFGKVNKVLGHAIGDNLLINIGEVMKLAADRYRMGARCFALGGDEFAIICPVSVAYQIRDAVEVMYEPFELPDGTCVSISGTIGSTLAEADATLQHRKKIQKGQLSCQLAA